MNSRIKNVLNFLKDFFSLPFALSLFASYIHTHWWLMMLLKLAAFVLIQFICVFFIFPRRFKIQSCEHFNNYLTPSKQLWMQWMCTKCLNWIFFFLPLLIFIINQIIRWISYKILIIGVQFKNNDLWWETIQTQIKYLQFYCYLIITFDNRWTSSRVVVDLNRAINVWNSMDTKSTRCQ